MPRLEREIRFSELHLFERTGRNDEIDKPGTLYVNDSYVYIVIDNDRYTRYSKRVIPLDQINDIWIK